MSSSGIFEFIRKNYPEYIGDQEYPISKSVFFHKKTDDHWILSNMATAPLVVNGIHFKNSEHLFQVMKFATRESVLAVYNSTSPKMTAKHYQKLGGHRREDWGERIIDVMKFCIQQKYEQCSEFREELERTKEYYIVELQDRRSDTSSSRPNGWGVKTKEDLYVGPNMMGRILMELRDKGKLDYNLPNDYFEFCQTILNPTV